MEEDRDWVPDEHVSDDEEDDDEGEDEDEEDEGGADGSDGQHSTQPGAEGDGSAGGIREGSAGQTSSNDQQEDKEEPGEEEEEEDEVEDDDDDNDGDDDEDDDDDDNDEGGGDDDDEEADGNRTSAFESAAVILGGLDEEEDDEEADDEWLPANIASPVRSSARLHAAGCSRSASRKPAAALRGCDANSSSHLSTPTRVTRSRVATPGGSGSMANVGGKREGRGREGAAQRSLHGAATPLRSSPTRTPGRTLTPSRRERDAEPQSDGAIAKRTRANYSLHEQQLEELEALLQTESSPPPSPRSSLRAPADFAEDEEDLEWRRFLLEIRQEAAVQMEPANDSRPGGAARSSAASGVGRVGTASGTSGKGRAGAHVEEEEEEEDRDYSYLADTGALDDSDEEWDDPDVSIPMDEVQELLADTAVLRQSARRSRGLAAAGSEDRLIASVEEDGASVQGPRTSSSGQPARLFTPEQIRHLQVQLHVHMQLLVQGMLLARKAMEIEPAYLQLAMLPYGMLAELCTYCDITAAYKQLRRRPTYATLLANASMPEEGSVESSNEELDANAADASDLPSIFTVPGLPIIAELLLSHSLGLKRLYDAPDAKMREALARDLAEKSAEREGFPLQQEMTRLAPHLNQRYLPRREQATSKSTFCTAEDHLLALGLRRYGLGRLDLIRANLLPSKSMEAIESRYRSKTTRRARDNPIQLARAECLAASLTPAEDTALVSAVKRHGENWPLIRMKILSHRSEKQLQEAWKYRLKPGAMLAPLPLPERPQVFGQAFSAAVTAAAASSANAMRAPSSTSSSMPPPPPRAPTVRVSADGAVPRGRVPQDRQLFEPRVSYDQPARTQSPVASSTSPTAVSPPSLGNASNEGRLISSTRVSGDQGVSHIGFAVDELSSSDGGDSEPGDGVDTTNESTTHESLRQANEGAFAVDELSSSDGEDEKEGELARANNERTILAMASGRAMGFSDPNHESARTATGEQQGATSPSHASHPSSISIPLRPNTAPTEEGDRAIAEAMQKCGGNAVAARDSLLAAGVIHFSYTTRALRRRCEELALF